MKKRTQAAHKKRSVKKQWTKLHRREALRRLVLMGFVHDEALGQHLRRDDLWLFLGQHLLRDDLWLFPQDERGRYYPTSGFRLVSKDVQISVTGMKAIEDFMMQHYPLEALARVLK